jgi:hypothetical protein
MDWDDEFENGYDDMGVSSRGNSSIQDKSSSEGGIDPLNITNPASAYFFLSDDAQDEISGGKGKNMKCQSCGHRFVGELYDSCPECFSSDTDEAVEEKNDGNW